MSTLAYIFSAVRIIEEAWVSGWSVAQLHSEFLLEGLPQNMSRWVPESLTTLWLLKRQQLQLTIAFERSSCIPLHPAVPFVLCSSLRINEAIVESSDTAFGEANFRYDNLFSELLGNLFCNIDWWSLKCFPFFSVAIGQSNCNLTRGQLCVLLVLLL
jgi:hypothetical protein